MVALTVNWTKLAMYAGMAAILLLCAALGAIVFLLSAVVAYGALCAGFRGAAALVFALGCMPVAGLCVIAMAFWQDHRRTRIRQAFGGPIL